MYEYLHFLGSFKHGLLGILRRRIGRKTVACAKVTVTVTVTVKANMKMISQTL